MKKQSLFQREFGRMPRARSHGSRTLFRLLHRRHRMLGAMAALLVAGLAAWLGVLGSAQAQEGAPPLVDNLRCITEAERVAFLWDAPEWSGGETYAYDYQLALPDGRSEGGRLIGSTLVYRPGTYPAGKTASVSVKAIYETDDGRQVSSTAAELTCYIGGPYPLEITPDNTTRVYGGTDAMSYTVSGLVDGDAVGNVVSGSLGRMPGEDVGSYDINLGTLAVAPAYATKYALPTGPTVATYTITPKAAVYIATGVNKRYDGTTAVAGILGGSFADRDIVPGDTVTVTGGSYPSADAGTGLAIRGSSVGGPDAGNYSVTLSVSGDITPLEITSISGVQVNSRLADRTTTATFDTGSAQGTGVVAGELADFRAGGLVVSGAFPAAAAGPYDVAAGSYDVSVTYSLQDHGSFKAGNYTLSSNAAGATLRGAIRARPPGTCGVQPVAVDVSDVPIVVTSTTADYFVLYVRPDLDADFEIPVSVTLGQDGTTTLTEQLAPLPEAHYRVEKYRIANPGDVDGDCIDDLTELQDLGTRNPLNRTRVISMRDGAAAIPDHETFERLSYRGTNPVDHHLDDLQFVKFVLFMAEHPVIYFQNTKTYKVHSWFLDGIRLDRDLWPLAASAMRGDIVYHPNVIAPDGSLGIYRFEFQPGEARPYWWVARANEVLAASMPFLENNLAYHPFPQAALPRYRREKALYDASRVNVLFEEDIFPDFDVISLNQGEGYGYLRVMSAEERPNPRDIVIYEALPNDLPRVAGIITTVPQTPLSHVNLRAVQDGIPNAFIRDALDDSDIDDLIGSHVHYTVTQDGYTLRAATKAEVDAHYDASRPASTQTPERDLSITGITALSEVGFDDWDAFGVKAANVAVLDTLNFPEGTVPDGFAVPFYFYDEFMKNAVLAEETLFGKKKWAEEDKFTLAAGTKLSAVVTAILAHGKFRTDYEIQEEMLDDLRDAIKDAESPQWIIDALTAMHATYPEGQSLRYRSSTNNEDLPGYSGAGLYDSKTQDPDETAEDGIDKSIKGVWASLWNFRAFVERDFHRIDHTQTAMGVLVHPNYSDEPVNGVAVSFDPFSGREGAYYVNTQVGEDLVTNPEAHSVPEEILLLPDGSYDVLAYSNQKESREPLMSDAQMSQLRGHLSVIHDRFAALYQPAAGEPFAMEIEFKITSANKLAIKQARPWVFAGRGAAPLVGHRYANLIARMKVWRNDWRHVSDKEHTDRWDRGLLAFGETVADASLTPMTAAEAQEFVDRGWTRWVEVTAALREIESGGLDDTPNQAPTVASAITDATIVNESGTRQVSLSGVFSDPDSDALTISASSSNEAVATVAVAPDYSGLTVTAKSRGTTTVTVTAGDGNGGTVEDTFTARVKAAPVVASAIADVSGLEVDATQDVSLSGVFSDADGDALTITAASSEETVATVTVSSDGSTLTLTGVAEGTATITVTAQDTDGNRASDTFDVPVARKYSALIAKIEEWRNDPQYVGDKEHTDRWDRGLLAFGETVADTSLTPMTAAEAQEFVDRGWTRWVEVTEALREIESGGQDDTPNHAPTVASAITDATIVNESGTQWVSLSGVFSDADSDSLTVTAGSDDEAVATVSVASDGSSLTVTAKSLGTATITVTANDGDGGTVEDTFTVRVKAAPVVASAIADVSGLEVDATQEVSLSGVFSDADGDTLTITAVSSDEAKATVTVAADQSKLTVAGVAEGTATITVTAQDTDGNRVSDTFDVSVGQANQAPTVASAITDATIVNESGTRQVSLSGVFSDPDSDALTISARSSNEAVATVAVAPDYSGLTVTAKSRGTTTVTVTAGDGNGGTVEDTFTARVKAAPVVASAISDLSGLEVDATQDVSLSGVFSDADGDALTITAASSEETVARVTVSSDGSTLMLTGVAEGTATITVTAQDTDGNRVLDDFDVPVARKYSALIAKIEEWRNDPQYVSDKAHTDRWDRTLLAFGETVSDTTLSPMTASEAQELVDRGWTRWTEVAAALRDLESGGQQDPPNGAPTVAGAIADAAIVSVSGTKQISLASVFSDPDSDTLTVTAGSSDNAVATVSVASDYSTLTVNAQSRGTATITVTADDGNGGTVSDTFTVRVKAAPVVASAIADVSSLEVDATQDVYLSGVFSDADGDSLTVTAASSDEAKATVTVAADQSKLTVAGVAEGTATITVTAQDSDGNRVSDAFDVTVSASQPQVNQAPTVSSALADATIVSESGTKQVSLSGVFNDADSDSLTVTAGSSDNGVATVSVASDHSTLTVTAKSRGTATVTVTADDGNGGTVSDTFTVRVKAAPVVASALSDVSSLEVDATQDVSLSGVFSDADGDSLAITAASSDEAKATVTVAADQSKLTVAGVAEGTATVTVTAQDTDGNAVSDTFDVSVTAPQQPDQDPPPEDDPPTGAPTVAAPLADISLEGRQLRQISLSGVFHGDGLTFTAVSSNYAVASMWVDGSTLNVVAISTGTATITVTAQDSDGNRVSDSFDVTVIPAS